MYVCMELSLIFFHKFCGRFSGMDAVHKGYAFHLQENDLKVLRPIWVGLGRSAIT